MFLNVGDGGRKQNSQGIERVMSLCQLSLT